MLYYCSLHEYTIRLGGLVAGRHLHISMGAPAEGQGEGAGEAAQLAAQAAAERGERIDALTQRTGDTAEAARALHTDAAALRAKLERENQWACLIL